MKRRILALIIIGIMIFSTFTVFAGTNNAGDESFIPDLPVISTPSDAEKPDQESPAATPSEPEKLQPATPSDAEEIKPATPSNATPSEITIIRIDIINTHIPEEVPDDEPEIPVATPSEPDKPDKPIDGGYSGYDGPEEDSGGKTPITYVEKDKIGHIDAYYNKDEVNPDIPKPDIIKPDGSGKDFPVPDLDDSEKIDFPKTGDDINYVWYLLGLSGIGGLAVWLIKKKKKI